MGFARGHTRAEYAVQLTPPLPCVAETLCIPEKSIAGQRELDVVALPYEDLNAQPLPREVDARAHRGG